MKILKSINEFETIEFNIDDIVRSDFLKSYIIAKYKLGLITNESTFENKTLEYDADAYPWDLWVLEELKKEFPEISSLENIHNEIPEDQIFNICVYVQDLFKTERWMKIYPDLQKDTSTSSP